MFKLLPGRGFVPLVQGLVQNPDLETQAGEGLGQRVMQFVCNPGAFVLDNVLLTPFLVMRLLDGDAEVMGDAGQ